MEKWIRYIVTSLFLCMAAYGAGFAGQQSGWAIENLFHGALAAIAVGSFFILFVVLLVWMLMPGGR